jgi:hypothetical protein
VPKRDEKTQALDAQRERERAALQTRPVQQPPTVREPLAVEKQSVEVIDAQQEQNKEREGEAEGSRQPRRQRRRPAEDADHTSGIVPPTVI